MGIKISMDLKVKINLNQKDEIFEAFRELENDVNERGSSHNKIKGQTIISYAYVTPGFSEKTTLKEIFDDWFFDVEEKNGFLHITEHLGEKLADIEHLFEALAHLIEPSSVITIHGDDDIKRVWTFQKGRMKQEEIEEGECEEEEEVFVVSFDNDPYEVLGIKPNANKSQIDLAYLKKISQSYNKEEINWARKKVLENL